MSISDPLKRRGLFSLILSYFIFLPESSLFMRPHLSNLVLDADMSTLPQVKQRTSTVTRSKK
jgi:hypothetical protein